MTSPGHRDYNRLKYYSALKTGYKHMGAKQSFLNIPHHTIDPSLYVIHFPFESSDPQGKHGSLTTIFSVWNAMVGTGLVTIPWAYS